MAVTQGQTYVSPVFMYDSTGLTANINGGSAQTMFTTVKAGMYRIHVWQRITSVGSVSSTLPSVDLVFVSGGQTITTGTSHFESYATDAAHLIATNTNNTLTTGGHATIDIYCDAATAIQVLSAGYAANATMTYEFRCRGEYLG